MQTTKVQQGYGTSSFMDGGAMPQEMMGAGSDPMVQQSGGDPMADLQPMVEGYMQNPDPALADQIIMGLANLMGIAPTAAPAPPVGAPAPDAGGMPMPGFKEGGKITSYLKTLQLK